MRSIRWGVCDLRSSMWPATNHDSLFGCPSFLFLMVMLVAANFGLQDPWRPTKQLVRGCQIAVLLVVVGSLQSMGPPQHCQSVVFCKRWVFDTSISAAWYESLFTNAKRNGNNSAVNYTSCPLRSPLSLVLPRSAAFHILLLQELRLFRCGIQWRWSGSGLDVSN